MGQLVSTAPYSLSSGHPLKDENALVSAAPFGSASILPISWAYIAMCSARSTRPL